MREKIQVNVTFTDHTAYMLDEYIRRTHWSASIVVKKAVEEYLNNFFKNEVTYFTVVTPKKAK